MSKQPQRPLLDTGLLTEQERQEALTRARRQMADQWAQAELGLAPKDGFKAPKGPVPIGDEEQCPITINLAPYSDRVVMDGTIYLHGHTYTLPKRRYDSLREIIDRTWEHQRIVDGKNANEYRQQRTVSVNTWMPGS